MDINTNVETLETESTESAFIETRVTTEAPADAQLITQIPEPQPELEEFTVGSFVYQKDAKSLANKWHGTVVKTEGDTVYVNWKEFTYSEPLKYQREDLASYA